MSQQPPALIPQVYVLWHPDCPHGERMATRILQWLRPGNGLGPEVFYRSLPDPAGTRLPPPLPDPLQRSTKGQKSVSNLQVVVMLVDEQMVADWSWRHWLGELAKSAGSTRVIMPVALDATAYNLPAAIRELNYLRPVEPPPAESTSEEARFEVVVRSLLKQITEAMCRLILPRSETAAPAPASSNAPLPKVNVFLSHAKLDGTVPARRLRDYIYSQTQLSAFFDENDIAFGDVFERVIQRTLDSNDTAALIAVRSAKYASRPWCRRELSLFRRPRRENTPSNGQAARWRLFPTLVVEALEGRQQSSGIPEFGNSTVIRWIDNDPGLEELIVTTVIRDAMLASFHASLGQSIPSHDKQIVINWLPDPTSLLTIDEVQSGEERDVLHPGRGLSGLELDTLYEFFPRLTFKSFEEALLWA
jgi:TIR domain-containing protein